MDNLAIPVGSMHKEAAHQFINYILRPEVGAAISNYTYYANTNLSARDYTDQEILADPAIYPDSEALAQSEPYQPRIGEANRQLNRIWAELTSP